MKDELLDEVKNTTIYNAQLDGVQYEVWLVHTKINSTKHVGVLEEVFSETQGRITNVYTAERAAHEDIFNRLEKLFWWIEF